MRGPNYGQTLWITGLISATRFIITGGWPETALMGFVLAGLSLQRYLQAKEEKADTKATKEVEQLAGRITKLELAYGFQGKKRE
jgi:hypothetical protein